MSNIKYTKEILEDAAKNSTSYAGILRYLNLKQAGGTQAHLIRKVEEYGIDTSHFTGRGHTKGKAAFNRKDNNDVFIVLPSNSAREKPRILKRALLESGVEYKCALCNLNTWLEKPLLLQIDHIDGNCLNNTKNNLRFLCPNCHVQTDTWANKKRPLVAQLEEAAV